MDFNKKKYIFVLIITSALFFSVFLIVNLFNREKRENISDLQRRITVDLITNETQFDLLKNAPCKAIKSDSFLSRQMEELGKKLVYAEETQGADNPDVINLKKYYSLLEVKDYLLSQEVAKKCDMQIESIVYFYESQCDDCEKQGLILTELKRRYPWVRIYSFDRDLDSSIVKTFAGLYNLSEKAPILIIGGEKYVGFKTIEQLENYIPELVVKKQREEIKKKAERFLSKNKETSDLTDLKFISFDKENNELLYLYSLENDSGDLQNKEIILIYSPEEDNFSIKKHLK